MKRLIVVSLFLCGIYANAADTSSTSTTDVSKAQVSAELGGAGLLYSVYGSYRFMDKLAANLGLSFWSISASSTTATASASVFLVPASVSLLLGKDNHNFEIKAGAVFGFGSSSSTGTGSSDKFTNSSVIPNFGVGYRYWPKDGGFHFRFMIDTFIAASSFIPWAGLSFGYAF